MVRYFYAWVPFVVVVGTAVLLTIPYLALIALLVVALVVPAVFAWAILVVVAGLSRTVSRAWEGRGAASLQAAPALAPSRRRHAFRPSTSR